MKKDSKFISRQDAAEVLGVSPQTISNYVNRGYIGGRMSGKKFWIDKESFYKLKDAIKTDIANEEELAKMASLNEDKKRELSDEMDKIDGMMECLREFRLDLHQSLYDMLEVYCRRCYSDLERTILRDIITNDEIGYGKYKRISEYIGKSPERVRQLACKAVRKSGAMMLAMSDELEEKTRRIEELEQKVEMLSVGNVKLMSEVDSCEFDYVYKDEWLGTTSAENDDMLSVRAINVIRSHSDSVDMTMYELVQKPISEVRRWRNLGKKTLGEMKDCLYAHGYEFGMNRDELLVKVRRGGDDDE